MRICIFGDSIAWGAYDPEGGGWVTRLRNRWEPEDVSVYNCGIEGDHSKDVLARFAAEMEAREPGVVVFAIGTNDAQYNGDTGDPRVSLSEYRHNIRALVSGARQRGARVAWIGLTRVDESRVIPIPWSDGNKCYNNARLEAYDAELQETCEVEQLPYCSTAAVLDNVDLHDGLHPNAHGHEKLFRAIDLFLRNTVLSRPAGRGRYFFGDTSEI